MYTSTETGPDELLVGADEIIQVHNDPDHLERGFIRFALIGDVNKPDLPCPLPTRPLFPSDRIIGLR